MSTDRHGRRHRPPGAPSGGQFTVGQRAESSPAASLATPPASGGLTELATGPWDQGHLLTEMTDRAAELVPDVPRAVVDDLWQDVLIASIRGEHEEKDRLIGRLVAWQEREQSWRQDPHFVEPQVLETEDDDGYRSRVGSRWVGGSRPTAQIARDVRMDLAESQRSGYLPAELGFRVRSRRFAGGSAIDVDVIGMADRDATRPDDHLWGQPSRSVEATTLVERVRAVLEAHGVSRYHPYRGGSTCEFYAHVRMQPEAASLAG